METFPVYRTRMVNFDIVKYQGRDINAARDIGRKTGFECVIDRAEGDTWVAIEAYSTISGSWRKIF